LTALHPQAIEPSGLVLLHRYDNRSLDAADHGALERTLLVSSQVGTS
jgi:hypothetical protein